jgi:hypothetical protein
VYFAGAYHHPHPLVQGHRHFDTRVAVQFPWDVASQSFSILGPPFFCWIAALSPCAATSLELSFLRCAQFNHDAELQHLSHTSNLEFAIVVMTVKILTMEVNRSASLTSAYLSGKSIANRLIHFRTLEMAKQVLAVMSLAGI